MKTVIQAPNQPWYVDNAAIMVLWGLIVDYFTALTNHGPRFGFYPDPEKSIVVVKENQEDDATRFFAGLNFKIVTGTRYLGGYMGSKEQE